MHTAAGHVALWYNTCLTHTRPWVKFPALPKKQRRRGGPGRDRSGRGVILDFPLVY